jgi:hypothetical protein
MVYARLSFPSRWVPLADFFGRSPAWLSSMFNDIVLFLYEKFKGILEWHPLITYEHMEAIALAMEELKEI